MKVYRTPKFIQIYKRYPNKITKYTTNYILHINTCLVEMKLYRKPICIPLIPVSAAPSQNTKL